MRVVTLTTRLLRPRGKAPCAPEHLGTARERAGECRLSLMEACASDM